MASTWHCKNEHTDECNECGAKVVAGRRKTCPKCGWSNKDQVEFERSLRDNSYPFPYRRDLRRIY